MATFARLLVLPAALALMLGMFAFIAPAQADATLTLTAESTTVSAGTDVELSWDSTDATTVDATGDWPTTGAKALDGTESVPTSAPGTLTFTLTADDDDPETPATSQTVEVTVTKADDSDQITPEAPAVEGCNFTIPDIEGLTYSASLDVESIPLEPDTYPQLIFSDDDDIVTIVATADDGFELADGRRQLPGGPQQPDRGGLVGGRAAARAERQRRGRGTHRLAGRRGVRPAGRREDR